jgi:hypothetical protein
MFCAVADVFQNTPADVVFAVPKTVTDALTHAFPPGLWLFKVNRLSLSKQSGLSRMEQTPSRLPHSSTNASKADFIFSKAAILAAFLMAGMRILLLHIILTFFRLSDYGNTKIQRPFV